MQNHFLLTHTQVPVTHTLSLSHTYTHIYTHTHTHTHTERNTVIDRDEIRGKHCKGEIGLINSLFILNSRDELM